MVHPAATSPSQTDHVNAARRSREHVDRLGDVMEGPVNAATDAAIDRLVTELTRELDGEVPDLRRRVDDERRRAELGYD